MVACRSASTHRRDPARARYHLRSTAAVLAIAGVCAWGIPQPSRAQCVPTNPASGSTVTCSSNQNGNYAVSGLSSLNVRVEPNANVNGTFSATGMGALDFLNGGNINGLVTLDTATNLVFRNSGVINQGLSITSAGTTVVINDAGRNINGTFQIAGDGAHTVTNGGTLNNGILLTGNGSSRLVNLAGATVNSGIQSTGTSVDTVDNSGTIQGGTFDLGAGNDTVISRAGVINNDVNTGAGDDTLTMLGGLLRRVNAGSGNDTATISGGQIDDRYSSQDGNDQLTWTGGTVRNIDMGDGTDLAMLRGLPAASLDFGTLTSVSGGLGAGDRLIFDDIDAFGPNRFTLWELMELTNGSSLTLGGGALTLGDAGTGFGRLSIEAGSTLFAGGGQSSILPFTPGQLVTVTNSGLIDLTNGGLNATDSLRIAGHYVGANGQMLLQTVLASDGSPSDRLIIDGGTGTGSTRVLFANVGGGRRPNHRGRHTGRKRDQRRHHCSRRFLRSCCCRTL